MRRRHADFEPVRGYLERERPTIVRLEWELNPVVKDMFSLFAMKPKRRPAAAPSTALLADIERTFEQAGAVSTVGQALHWYFHLNAPPTDRAVSLAAAVEHVEAFGAPGEFLLPAHPEGGLVSVSRDFLPFQAEGQDAGAWLDVARWQP